jgi:ABC-2 type transport system permease protein
VLEKLGSPWRTPEESSLLLAAIRFTVRRFGWLLRAYRIDEEVLHEILRARVLIGLRTQATQGDSSGVTGLVLTILACMLAGLLTGVIAIGSSSAELWIVASQSGLLFLLWMGLVTQFATLLVDPADVGMLAPHPVEDRTLFAARLVHVLALLLIFSVSFTAANMFLALFGKPPLAVLLVVPLLSLLCSFVALGSVALPMALLLRIVGPAHFQRLSLWLQILAAAFAFGGYQLVLQLVPHEAFERLWQEQRWLFEFWPPLQYAALFDLACGAWTRSNVILTAIALLTPVLAFAITFQLASRYFVAGLEGTLAGGRTRRASWTRGWAQTIEERSGGSRERRAGFDFALALSRREPVFLRAILPQAIGFQFMALAMLEPMHKAPAVFLAISPTLLALTLPTLLEVSQSTPVPEARWIFLAAPMESEDELLRGGIRGLFFGWWTPIVIVLAAIQLSFVGWSWWPQVLLAHLSTLCMALAFARYFRLGIPFTRPPQSTVGAFDNVGLILLMFLASAVVVGLQFLLSLVPGGVWIGLAAASLLTWLTWRALQRIHISPIRRLIGARGLVLEDTRSRGD